MESAKRIADAAISDLRQHEEGPVTKRRRVEETCSDKEEQEESKRIEDPLSSCVRQVPSGQQGSSSTIFPQPPEGENVYESLESRDVEKEDEKKSLTTML